jgi:Tol biopolymer transport system component
MTTFDRFDPFERRIGEALDGIAPVRRLDYLDDVFRQTVRTSQRPRWSFPERWLNVDTTLARPMLFGRRVPIRSLLALVVLAALLATAALYVGTQKRLPPPFGPAANGQVAYAADGDIHVRDTLGGVGRVLVGGPGDQIAPAFSPDGTRLAYVTAMPDVDLFYLANADGSAAREIARIPKTGNAWAVWSPDSQRMALIYDVGGVPQLSIANTDGAPATVLDLAPRVPLDLAWSAPSGDRLLVRTRTSGNELLTVRPDGSDVRVFDLPASSRWGTDFTLSGATYSPDGTTIAYNGVDLIETPTGELLEQFRVHLVNADGTNDRAVPGPSDPYVQENWPLFSPDGQTILVHRWHFSQEVEQPRGWLAVMPADGSAPARDIGPRIDGGEATGLIKIWSPDGTRVVMRADNLRKVYSIDPDSGAWEELSWTTDLPDWQRLAP